jgi:hypothetical protein
VNHLHLSGVQGLVGLGFGILNPNIDNYDRKEEFVLGRQVKWIIMWQELMEFTISFYLKYLLLSTGGVE